MRAQLPHALLVHGPAGIGKLSLAEHFAQYLLCEAKGERSEPCGRCEACHWLAAGNHPDLRRIQPEALRKDAVENPDEPAKPSKASKPSIEIRVDEIRALGGFLNVGSHRGGRRIALVQPAESMNVHAANSLLKGLEEPPAGAMFVLVSDRPERLLPTIRSRCVALPIPRPDAGEASAWLASRKVPDAARWLALAGGAPLLALQYSEPERRERMQRLLKALASGNHAALAAVSDREELEMLAEILQKNALDQAFLACGARARFAFGEAGSAPGAAKAWLDYARRMGANRALARHPLNPRLFAGEMLAAMPGKGE